MVAPKLRFREFSGEWDHKLLGSVTSKIGSGSTPKGGSQVYLDLGIPFIRSQNVNNDKLLLNELVFISSDTDKKMKGSRVKPGDILLNITGASIGRSCVVPESFDKGNVNQHVCIIRLSNGKPRFYQNYLSSQKGQKLIELSQSGSGREGLNFENIRKFKIASPTIQEQAKIADFLSSVDEKIALQTKQYELLCHYKKGVMQRIFSQELRFKDENGEEFAEWIYISLDNMATITKGKAISSANIIDGPYPVIAGGKSSPYSHNDFTHENIITVSASGAYAGFVSIHNQKIWASDCCVIKPIEKNILSFLYQQLIHIQINIYSLQTGGAQPHIYPKDLCIITVACPTDKEQTKIADFLTAIDDKIAATKKQLEQLKQWKQGLLQQMFI
ncbi:TPA: restriction endonuclease subunit S [Yersinia enterocolitica]